MLTADTVLQGRYRIVRQLGQGGMGAVYEAIDERLDTTVALKETLFTDEKLRKQFEREARLLARSEEHTSELQSRLHLVCRLLLEKKKNKLRRSRTERTVPNTHH